MIDPFYAFSGFVVGILVGLTGVGGGSLMTPLLIAVFGLHPAAAVGTDLLFAATTKGAGATVHGLARNIEWKIVGRLAGGSVPATILTLIVLREVGTGGRGMARTIVTVLGVTLLVTATALLMKDPLMHAALRRAPERGRGASPWVTVVVGAVVGALVSLTSVSAGALGTIALLFLYPKLPMSRIVGSDIAHAVPLTLLAGLGHWWLGAISSAVLGSLLVGSIPGVVIASFATRLVPERALRYALALVLVLAGAKMLT